MKKLVILGLVLFSFAASAADEERIRDLEQQIGAAREDKKEAAENERNAKKDVEGLREELVTVTREVQKREKALLKITERQRKTEGDIKDAEAKLKSRRESLARMILALQRLDRLPPQALLARPSAPIDTARSYVLLEQVLPELSAEAKRVKDTLDQLALLRATQKEQQAHLKAESDDLKEQQSVLKDTVGKRMAQLRQTSGARREAEKRASALARQVGNLRDLVTGLTREKDQDSVKESLFSWFSRSGQEMPVVGVVETGYGEELTGGGASQGLRIRANSGAVVVSPANGTVKFAGPFRQYKLLVIVQHENGDHSLLGGLEELYTRVGEHVGAGEPIGKLAGDSTRMASLYYERRHRGKPVDPRRATN